MFARDQHTRTECEDFVSICAAHQNQRVLGSARHHQSLHAHAPTSKARPQVPQADRRAVGGV
eukprot:3426063-Rhodomonas_salina.1